MTDNLVNHKSSLISEEKVGVPTLSLSLSASAVFLYPLTNVLKILRSLGKSRETGNPHYLVKERLTRSCLSARGQESPKSLAPGQTRFAPVQPPVASVQQALCSYVRKGLVRPLQSILGQIS